MPSMSTVDRCAAHVLFSASRRQHADLPARTRDDARECHNMTSAMPICAKIVAVDTMHRFRFRDILLCLRDRHEKHVAM